ncbi:MAG: bis-aminopropyl spermidine synthase family protein [Candidatus Nealsonbacteria bacterium]
MPTYNTEKYLRDLYSKWLKFSIEIFFLDRKKFSTSFKELKVSDKVIEEVYNSYYKVPFFVFLAHVKDIIFSNNVFDFILKNASEDWKLWPYLKFLEKEKIIKVQKSGKVILLKKDILNCIPEPKTEKEIKAILEKKLKVRVREGDTVVDLFKDFGEFEVKAGYDQMPISQGSAIYVVKKILEKIPFKGQMLFLGDDDFVSIILGLVEPKMECVVSEIDEQLINKIKFLSSKFKLNIRTERIDFIKDKNKKIKGNFVGFLTNPVYTLGAKEFVKFGINQFGKDGGFGLLEIGDEALGTRFLFLQDFFTKNNLIISELTTDKIFYPFISLYKEDKEILRRMSEMVDRNIVLKAPRLGASLYVLKYLPQKPKIVKFKKHIYDYL